MDTKTCTSCHEEKPLTDEYFAKASPSQRIADGYKNQCRVCTEKKRKAWRAKYKEEHGEHDGKRWQQSHREDTAHRAMSIYRELGEWVDSLKNEPCMDCGQKFPAVCMDWDHVRGEKKGNVAWLISNRYSRKAILEEIEKCDLVCANCHRIRTWESEREMPWYDKIRKYSHGSY